MKTLIFFTFATIVVMTKAGLIHLPHHHVDDELQNVLSYESHDSHVLEDESEFEECICGEGDDFEDGNVTDSSSNNSIRTKRQCGCGYGYCGCTAATTAKVKAAVKNDGIFVFPFPIPAPAPAPAPIPAVSPSQTFVLPHQTQLPQQAILPQTSIFTGRGNGSGESACDRLRLILTLTNQLEGLKLIEIAGQCVVQIEK